MTNILDQVNLWDAPYNDDGIKQICTVREVEDDNKNKMYRALLDGGYTFTEKFKQCVDGEIYEITEIRGPKASGFFFV